MLAEITFLDVVGPIHSVNNMLRALIASRGGLGFRRAWSIAYPRRWYEVAVFVAQAERLGAPADRHASTWGQAGGLASLLDPDPEMQETNENHTIMRGFEHGPIRILTYCNSTTRKRRSLIISSEHIRTKDDTIITHHSPYYTQTSSHAAGITARSHIHVVTFAVAYPSHAHTVQSPLLAAAHLYSCHCWLRSRARERARGSTRTPAAHSSMVANISSLAAESPEGCSSCGT